jgi:hypothetical protein
MGNYTSTEANIANDQDTSMADYSVLPGSDFDIVYKKTYAAAVKNEYHERYTDTGDIDMPRDIIDARYLSDVFERIVAHKSVDSTIPTANGAIYVIPNNADFERLIQRVTQYIDEGYQSVRQTTTTYFMINYWLPFLCTVLTAHDKQQPIVYRNRRVLQVTTNTEFLPVQITRDADDYIIEMTAYRITPAVRNPVNSTVVMCCRKNPKSPGQ